MSIFMRFTRSVRENPSRLIAIAAIVFAASGIVYAFQEPSSSPPGGTVYAPVNTGPTAQTKSGNITSSGTVTGNVINATGQVCIVGDCRSVWPSGGGGGGIGGSGTANYLSKFTGATSLGNSRIFDNGTNVGIGTTNPQQNLSVQGGLNIDQENANSGTGNALTFGSASGEAIGSRRAAGTNQYGLDFYTGYTSKMSITNGGNVGIGTANPGAKLEVNGGILLPNNTALYGKDTSGRLLPLIQSGGDNSTLISIGGGGGGFYSSSYKLFVDTRGNVGIGTMNPRLKLDVNGPMVLDGNYYITTSLGLVGAGDLSRINSDFPNQNVIGGMGWCRNCSGLELFPGTGIAGIYNQTGRFAFESQLGTPSNVLNLVYAGSFIARVHEFDVGVAYEPTGPRKESDARLKTNIAQLTGSLDKFGQIRGVSFEWVKSAGGAPGTHLGVIAQEVESVFPDLVATDPKTGYKSVTYEDLIPPLIEAVKELKAENDALQHRIEALEAR